MNRIPKRRLLIVLTKGKMNEIIFDNVSKKARKMTLMSGVSFRLPSEAVSGIIGPMDSGKSTALKLISGLEKPDSGNVRFVDQTTGLDIGRPQMGILISGTGMYPNLSVYDHFQIKSRLMGLPFSDAEQLMEQFRITNIRNIRMGLLTLQLRNTVGIALALMGNPPLILLDEPFTGFRYQDIDFIKAVLKSYQLEHHATLVIASRTTEEIADITDAFIFLQEGNLVKADTKDDIISNLPGYIKLVADPLQDAKDVLNTHEIFSYQTKGERVLYIFEKLDQVDEIRQILEDAGVAVTECAVVHDSMEDYFASGRRGGVR